MYSIVTLWYYTEIGVPYRKLEHIISDGAMLISDPKIRQGLRGAKRGGV